MKTIWRGEANEEETTHHEVEEGFDEDGKKQRIGLSPPLCQCSFEAFF